MTRLLLVAAVAGGGFALGAAAVPRGRHGSGSDVWVCGGRRSRDRSVAESGVIAARVV